MIIGLLILILDVVAIMDIVKSWETAENKALWILLIVFLPFLGMVLYFLLKKKK